MDRQTLSIMKACEVVGVSRRTIYNWISAGKVEYVRTAGGSIRIFADTLWRSSPASPAGVNSTEGRDAAAPASRPADSQGRVPGSHA
jgi:excisionase family DNA binding protein